MPEPLGMLAHVRVIGRGLEGDVERDLEAVRRGRVDEAIEVVERAEPRLDRGVAALLGANRPRAARIVRRRRQRVVAALAEAAADRDESAADRATSKPIDAIVRQQRGRLARTWRCAPDRSRPSAGTSRTTRRTARARARRCTSRTRS